MPSKPALGTVSSPYGWRVHPITGVRTHHNGTDFSWDKGWGVYAPERCTVVSYGEAGGYGNLLTLLGVSGAEHRLAHLASASVRKGQTLAERERAATIGNTGASIGAHLHWETRINGRLLNPMDWLASTAGGGGSSPFPTPIPEPIPPLPEEPEMKPRMVYTQRPEDGKKRWALYVAGTPYFAVWDQEDAKLANKLAKQNDTGDAVELQWAEFEVLQKAAAGL